MAKREPHKLIGSKARIAILGSGMAGYGAAYRLQSEGLRSTMYDKNPYHGGRTSSHKYNGGFIFDEGPHVSFTEDRRIQDLLAESVNQKYETREAHVNNYWRGYWIKHPAQCNLYGLPPKLVVNILVDFIQENYKGHNQIDDYAEWLVANYGQTFAKTFPMEYTLKFHTTKASNMSTDWMGPRLYKPSLEEVLHGAISPKTPNFHYCTQFRYPSVNGFVSYLNLFLNMAELKLSHRLVRLDPREQELFFENGAVVQYDAMISSIPLPDLIPMISGTPVDVIRASKKLACSSCVLVNIGINREDISEAQWTYFYDRDIIFTRLSFPHMMSPNNVPPGTGSIQAEIYFSEKYRPLDLTPAEYIQPVIADLQRCNLIREEDKVVFKNVVVCKYANVIFDLERATALKVVHGYLDDLGIAYCGRYGDWGYLWTDESFKSGENAAQKVLERMNS